MKQKRKIILVAAAMTFSMMGTSLGASSSIAHMSTLGKTSQPIGHAKFCRQFRNECSVRTSKSKAPKLTRANWNSLVEVNSHINQAVQPVTDMEYYGTEEHWTYPKNFGDCEDYVLLKRYLLMKRGWPASSLLITVVRQPNGDGHAVLTVRTTRADYVLDNLESKVKAWNKTPYRYLKRQSANHTGKWITINDTRNKVASIAK